LQCTREKAKNSANGGSSARQPINPDRQVYPLSGFPAPLSGQAAITNHQTAIKLSKSYFSSVSRIPAHRPASPVKSNTEALFA